MRLQELLKSIVTLETLLDYGTDCQLFWVWNIFDFFILSPLNELSDVIIRIYGDMLIIIVLDSVLDDLLSAVMKIMTVTAIW